MCFLNVLSHLKAIASVKIPMKKKNLGEKIDSGRGIPHWKKREPLEVGKQIKLKNIKLQLQLSLAQVSLSLLRVLDAHLSI